MAAVADVTTRPDSAINQDVILELKWDPKITSNDIAVAVKDGVVTLSGFASSYMEKDAAEKAANVFTASAPSRTTFRLSCRPRGPIRRLPGTPCMSWKATC